MSEEEEAALYQHYGYGNTAGYRDDVEPDGDAGGRVEGWDSGQKTGDVVYQVAGETLEPAGVLDTRGRWQTSASCTL